MKANKNYRAEMRKQMKADLIREGLSFEKSWDELSSYWNDKLVAMAKESGYTHKYNPNCYLCKSHQLSYAFYYHLKNKVE